MLTHIRFQIWWVPRLVEPEDVWQNNFYYIAESEVDPFSAYTVLESFWLGVLAPIVSALVEVDRTTTGPLDPVDEDPDYVESLDNAGWIGSTPGCPQPGFVAVCVNRVAPGSTTARRGRVFIPAPGAELFRSYITGELQTNHVDLVALKDALLTPLTVDGVTLTPALRSRVEETLLPLVETNIRPFVSVIRSRQYGQELS